MAGKNHTSSSPRRKERRAQLWSIQQVRKAKRRDAGKAAAEKNRALRKEGKSTPTDMWVEVKERAAEARVRRREERGQSQFRKNLGGPVKVDNRTPELRQAWRDFIADRADVFLP